MTDEYRIHFETVSKTQKSLIRAKGVNQSSFIYPVMTSLSLLEHHRPSKKKKCNHTYSLLIAE